MAGRVLIADEVVTNRIILKAKLAAACYEVLQARDAADVHVIARQARPDLILLDESLPGGGAARTCRNLKTHPATRDIPVVVISSVNTEKTRLAAIRAGAEDVQAKPLDETILLALARNLIRAHSQRGELLERRSLAEDMGFAEDTGSFARPGRVAVVSPAREAGYAWRLGLKPRLGGQVEVVTKSSALALLREGDPPDAFVVPATLEDPGDGLNLVSELRSRNVTRHAVIIALTDEGNANQSVMALDLGADAVLPRDVGVEEMSVRLKLLLARKLESDALRASLDERLSLAMKDPLTGLYNLRYARSYLARIASTAEERKTPFTLMLLDLDRFKTINDTYGHAAGDAVLIEVAKRLKDKLREIDLLARIGGEEFLVALPETDIGQAKRVADRLRRTVGDRPVIAGDKGPVSVTLSIGAVIGEAASAAPGEVEAMLERADQALYASKAEGRNLVTFIPSAA